MCAVHGEQVGDCLPLCRFGQLELGKQHDRVVCNLFPPRPLESRGEMEKVAKQTDAQRQLAILSLMWRSSSNGHLPQAKPSHVESRLVRDEDEDETASVAEVVANEVHANPAQSLRLDLALIFG